MQCLVFMQIEIIEPRIKTYSFNPITTMGNHVYEIFEQGTYSKSTHVLCNTFTLSKEKSWCINEILSMRFAYSK